MKLKEILLPTIALLVICVAVTGALSLTNFYTKDAIAAQEQKAINEGMAQLVPGGEYTDLSGSQTDYSVTVGGVPSGYIFLTEAMGYKSYIKVMTAFDTAGTIIGVNVVDCADESPGIGQKVGTDTGFLAQFTGQDQPIDQIDAITGATYSAQGVKAAVNLAIEKFQSVAGKAVTATDVVATVISCPTGGADQ